jgi:hypothetical protein
MDWTKGSIFKGPAAEAKDAPQPWGLLYNPVMKVTIRFFFRVLEHRWNEIDRENRNTRGKTCPSATLFTTWSDPGSSPRLRDGRPATNRLSHGTAQVEKIKKITIYCNIV